MTEMLAARTKNSKKIARHPCFSGCASKRFGRVHLPVAVGCNIRCNYCDRRYSCVNESRPGVAARILRPDAVVQYLKEVITREPRISVVGIAGPGDPLFRPAVTLQTLHEVHKHFPNLLLCLSTNGLNLSGHEDALVRAGVGFVTVTVNAVNPEIGALIYSRVSDGKIDYLGKRGASLLLSRQLAGIKELKHRGVIVKVNTIIIPGVNDCHAEEIAEKMAALDVDLMNCIAMIPVPGVPFGDKPEIGTTEMEQIRRKVEPFLPQMHHCTRCRADASGMLEKVANFSTVVGSR